MYRELKDRAQYYVALSDFDAANQGLPAYGNDGRPLRFVKIDDQPSGKFALFEGSTVDLRRVKEIEQDPSRAIDLFRSYLSTIASVPVLTAYRIEDGVFSDRGKSLARFDAAVKRNDVSTAASALQQFAALTDNRKPTPLPPELIESSKPDTEAPTKLVDGSFRDPSPYDLPEIPWGKIAIGALVVGGLYVAAKNIRSEDEDDY